jgi:hypothetical protein
MRKLTATSWNRSFVKNVLPVNRCYSVTDFSADMKTNAFIVLLLLATLQHSLANKPPVLVSGTASTVLRDDEAKTEQLARLVEEAQSNAMRSAFGNIVLLDEQLEVDYEKSNNMEETSGKKYHKKVSGWSGGTWIADNNPPEITESENEKGEVVMTANVRGYAQPFRNNNIPFQTEIGTCDTGGCPARIFRAGEPVFFRFTAGSNGSLMIALEDPTEETVSFIQSANAMPLQVMNGIATQLPPQDFTGNLVLTVNDEKNNIRQYVWFFFSPNAMQAPATVMNKDAIPAMSVPAFRSWFHHALLSDDQLQFTCTPISVIPNTIHE